MGLEDERDDKISKGSTSCGSPVLNRMNLGYSFVYIALTRCLPALVAFSSACRRRLIFRWDDRPLEVSLVSLAYKATRCHKC
jgi:hypothetical protein